MSVLVVGSLNVDLNVDPLAEAGRDDTGLKVWNGLWRKGF